VEEVGEAEDENTEDELVSPDEDGVGKESEEEGEDEEVVGAEFALGIDENEENADIFDETSDGRGRIDDVDDEERDINNGPEDEPATIGELEGFGIFHTYMITW